MIEEPAKLIVKKDRPRPSAEQVAAFTDTPTGFVVDAMFGRGALDTRIAPLGGHRTRIAGPALCAENGAGDILATLAALAFLQEGDVLVVGVQGWQGCSASGDRVCGMARNAGAAGYVSDGPMRDIDGIEEVGLPCWSTGLNPGSPFTTGPGTVGGTLSLGGQRVATGDMIVADRDGVVIVPYADIDRVIARLDDVRRLETELDAEVRDGLKVPQAIRDLIDSDDTRHE